MAKSENSAGSNFNTAGIWIALIPAVIFGFLLTLVPEVMVGKSIQLSLAWVPSLGAGLDLLVDGLSLVFGLIISLVGVLVVLYASGYLAGDPQLKYFYAYTLFFMLAMLGVVFSSNLLSLFIFWELTSLSSYLLIGFYHQQAESREAARQALLVTGMGGLALLAGVLLLGQLGGSFDLVQLLSGDAGKINPQPLMNAALILILLGAFTKSAQFPFHFWLPGAMAAPAPVSAYLHSATMVKAGIYLLARLSPIFSETSLWSAIVIPVGAVTMLLGAWLALGKTDLKQILAYSTVSVLGMLTFLLGLGSSIAVKAAIVLLIAHALYKGALFLAAGAVDHETGSREILELRGLRRRMPLITIAVSLAALSQAGIPLLFGFISKELLYEATLAAEPASQVLTALAVGASVMLVAVAAVVAIRPFWGKLSPLAESAHDPHWSLWLGPVLLGGLSLVMGIFPGIIGQALIAPAASAVLGETFKVKLAVWHGITPMLILSLITVGLGGVGFAASHSLRWLVQRSDLSSQVIGPQALYRRLLQGVEWLAYAQTRLLQNGSLPTYIMIVVLTAVGLISFSLLSGFDWHGLVLSADELRSAELRVYELIIPVLILAAVAVVVSTRSRLTAVAALGVIGFGVAVIYVFFGAPDLAMTQFAIETLTVTLFVLVLYRLPRFIRYTGRATRSRDALIALAAGGMMSLLVLAITATPLVSRLTPYFAENSVTLAKGRNIVNVILVDFRGIDTMGEITVLAVAAIGVFALMKLRAQD